VPPCSLKAGHDGAHHCVDKDHLCGDACHLSHLRNCMESCALDPGHDGPHECVSKRHLCKEMCDLPCCANSCQSPHDVAHEVHRCQEIMCPFECVMQSCPRKCDCGDHFHDMIAGGAVHLCGNVHQCEELCEEEGICKIDSQLTRVKRTFDGKHGAFDYDHQVEQNGHREKCCVVIPAGETSHRGRHLHTEKEDAVHYCEEKCPTCDYYCNKAYAHQDEHDCKHGNMTAGGARLVASEEDFAVGERMYGRGESAKAEMCDMLCRTLGRGHVHLQKCRCTQSSPSSSTGGPFVMSSQAHGGARSAGNGSSGSGSGSGGSGGSVSSTAPLRKHVNDPAAAYSINTSVDETTHDEYWRSVGWADPCMPEEQASFRKCSAVCTVASHHSEDDGGDGGDDGEDPAVHCCSLNMLHEPLDPRNPPTDLGYGFVSRDGHFFTCSQCSPAGAAFHIVFIVDASGSMAQMDARPADARISAVGDLDSRLGCAIEACDRFVGLRHRAGAADRVSLVLFGSTAHTAIHFQAISEDIIVDFAGRHLEWFRGSTNFHAAFVEGRRVIETAARSELMPTLIMFLTDGHGENERSAMAQIEQLRQSHADIELRSIGFGTGYNVNSLRSIAGVLGDRGRVLEAVDEAALVQEFEATAEQLGGAKIGVLAAKELSDS